MFLVEKATLAPAMCAFTKSAEGPFIDMGRDFDFDHVGRVYLRVSYARELGRFAGLVEPDEIDRLRSELDEANARVLQLEEELAAADGVIDAIDVIESRDFRTRRRPGRPKGRKTNDEVEEVAA